MFRIILPLLILLSGLSAAQAPYIPDEAKPFILPTFEAMDYQTGDINGDKKEDAILVLSKIGADKNPDDRPADYDVAAAIDRPFIILLRQPNGKLKQVLRNDSLILCFECSGIGEPYKGIKMIANGFVVTFVGDAGDWRWIAEYKFLYQPVQKKWLFNNEKRSIYKYNNPEGTIKTTFISQTELGTIPVEKFSSSSTYEEAKWKVIAPKTFFYDTPDLKSKHGTASLVKNNLLTGIRRFTNFVLVSYNGGNGEVATGFVLKKDLQKIK
jgi:hypothetical protein